MVEQLPDEDWRDYVRQYGKGRSKRRFNYILKRRNVALWLGLGLGVSLGMLLLPWLLAQ